MSTTIRDHPDWNDASSRLSSIVSADIPQSVGPGGNAIVTFPSQQLGNCNVVNLTLPPKCGAQVVGVAESGPAAPFVCETVNPETATVGDFLVFTDWGGGCEVVVKNADNVTHTVDVQMIAFLLADFDQLVQPFTYQTFAVDPIAGGGNSGEIQIPTVQFYDRVALAVVVDQACSVTATWWSIPDSGTFALVADVQTVGTTAGAGTVRDELTVYGSALTIKVTNASMAALHSTIITRCHRESG